MGTITRAATREPDQPLNVVTFPTHEAYETCLARTGYQFWSIRTPAVKDWNRSYRPVPPNYVLCNPANGDKQLPSEVDIDVILSQNKFGQYQIAHQLARQLHVPLVSLEHTLPVPEWGPDQLANLRAMRGHANVFISEFSRKAWGWGEAEAEVVHHGIDTETFSPNELLVDKKAHVLSAVNDWVKRDWCCGFRLWQEVAKDLPHFVVGDTPGLSKPTASVAELVMRYREAQVFLNTSLVSPVPTALLEAMACGCAVVSSATCMVPDIIENGKNGFVSNDPRELAGYCRLLLQDADMCVKLGRAARQTILDRFSLEAFVANWQRVLTNAAGITFTGQL